MFWFEVFGLDQMTCMMSPFIPWLKYVNLYPMYHHSPLNWILLLLRILLPGSPQYGYWKKIKKFLKDQVFKNRPLPGYFGTLSHLAVPNVFNYWLFGIYQNTSEKKPCTILGKRKWLFSTTSASVTLASDSASTSPSLMTIGQTMALAKVLVLVGLFFNQKIFLRLLLDLLVWENTFFHLTWLKQWSERIF